MRPGAIIGRASPPDARRGGERPDLRSVAAVVERNDVVDIIGKIDIARFLAARSN
ncbi:MAG: hypothetical protein IT515_09925 [Burkholderiales bacterium]|nr:hypothetical protein [Burkholderiales bacterium]